MSLPGRMQGVYSLISSLLKDVRIPGAASYEHGDGNAIVFNTLTTDQLYPLTGLDNNPTFYIREDAYYNLYFTCRQPPGFGTGWTGTGTGGGFIRTNRYGDEALVNWGPNDQSEGDHIVTCGPIKRYLYYGDWVQFYTNGSGTGHGVVDWDVVATITRLRS